MSDSARIGVLVSALFIAVFSGSGGLSAAQETGWKAEEVTTVVQTGLASYYSGHGPKASGKTHDSGLTAAHRTLPFGSRVQVTDIRSGREVVVVIDDRGPFRKKRIIDLSRKAAAQLGILKRGIARVRIRQID
ncbi:MAG: septal ring lytic transglycosylase RlpA family protein [Rhodomicrobiaceae bacterium]